MTCKEVIGYYVFDISKERILSLNSYFKKKQKKAKVKGQIIFLRILHMFLLHFSNTRRRETLVKTHFLNIDSLTFLFGHKNLKLNLNLKPQFVTKWFVQFDSLRRKNVVNYVHIYLGT